MILKSSLSGNYTVTTSYANIENSTTGQEMSITIPEDGYYHIIGTLMANVFDSDGSEARLYLKLAVDGTRLSASGCFLFTQTSVNGLRHTFAAPINNFLYLKKGQVVTVQAYMESGDNSTITATNGQYATYMEAINLTKLARGGM